MAEKQTERCGDCRFWNRPAKWTAQCRRHAPATVAYTADSGCGDVRSVVKSQFPMTHAHDWCGEFVRVTLTEDPPLLAGEGVR